jgi:hypothetical protein
MKRTMRWVGVCLLFSLAWGVAGMHAQQPVSAEPQAPSRTVQTPPGVVPTLPVPRLVKLAGTLKDELGKPRTGVVGVTFAIYKEREGGATLWLETQNVELDEQGRYTVLLGATKSEGISLDLFAAGEPRWLGVQVNLPRELEQPRVLLVSVPYALKAADAETLGGKPLSSFMLAPPSSEGGVGVGAVLNPTSGATAAAMIGGGGTQNFVAKFDSTGTNVINSLIFDNGTFVGIGTTNPDSHLHIQGFGPDVVFNLQNTGTGGHAFRFDATNNNSVFGGGKLVMQDLNAGGAARFTIDSNGFMGIGTASPGTELEVAGNLKISGGGNALVFPDGTVMSSAASGVGGGTITGVTAGAGLSGGGTAGGVTINIATGGVTNSMLANSSIAISAGTGLTGGGSVTLGNSLTLSNTGVLSFNGRPGSVTSTAGDYSFAQISGAATTTQLPAASLVRAITYLAGCDSCSLLTTADSQNTIFLNVIGSMTINSVTCFSDAGAPTINIQRNQAGTLTNVLSANLTCSTTGATSSSLSTSTLSLNDSLNFTMATADGVAKRVTVIIKATVN